MWWLLGPTRPAGRVAHLASDEQTEGEGNDNCWSARSRKSSVVVVHGIGGPTVVPEAHLIGLRGCQNCNDHSVIARTSID